jgi:hypothetical protein
VLEEHHRIGIVDGREQQSLGIVGRGWLNTFRPGTWASQASSD